MPDITMCDNDACPLQNECYRFLAETTPHRQSYAHFEPKEVKGEETTCEHFYDPPKSFYD